MSKILLFTILAVILQLSLAIKKGYKEFPTPVAEHIISPRPHEYLRASDLPGSLVYLYLHVLLHQRVYFVVYLGSDYIYNSPAYRVLITYYTRIIYLFI